MGGVETGAPQAPVLGLDQALADGGPHVDEVLLHHLHGIEEAAELVSGHGGRAGADEHAHRVAGLAVGVPRERVHHEFFAPGGGAYRARSAAAAGSDPSPRASSYHPGVSREGADPVLNAAEGAEVVAILDGIRHRFMVPPGSQVVDAALAAGIRVPYSCKGGMCCTCRAKVVEGTADMVVNYSLEPWEIERGFILTGPDLDPNRDLRDWPLDRPPYLLETNVPGIFASGDARHNSVKRVASAVGEGSVAVYFMHQFLAAR